MKDTLAYQVTLDLPFDQALERTAAALKEEGFGVLTEIDIKATLKEKIGVDVEPHIILGACNPPLAHKAITSQPLAALTLPCNVTVRETDQGSLVSIINPHIMLSVGELAGDPDVQEVADEAAGRLERVVAALRG